ncbi:MAG: hypothetical protein RMY34_16315 [Aulosira sp. DedQUE10]|nr:hypothetical protein [Aulosira sp. DedQUE10]
MDSLTEGKKGAIAQSNGQAIAFDVFAGGGEMGELMRRKDWSNTPLGSVENWPQSLRTSVSTMLASRFAQTLLWGEDYIQLYNDAMIPIYGAKHPEALGYSLREIWSEVWNDQVKPMLEGIKNTGEAVFVEDQLFQLFFNSVTLWATKLEQIGYPALKSATDSGITGGKCQIRNLRRAKSGCAGSGRTRNLGLEHLC